MSSARRRHSPSKKPAVLPAPVQSALENSHDLLLLRLCFRRTGATAAGGFRRQQHRGRAAIILEPRIGAAFQKRPYGRGASRPHGPMQRRHAHFVGGIRVGSRLDEAADRGRLRCRIPRDGSRLAHSGVMQWLVAKAIFRVDVGALFDQPANDFRPIRSRGDMQCRVAFIYVAANLLEIVWLRRSPARSVLKACCCQEWCSSQ